MLNSVSCLRILPPSSRGTVVGARSFNSPSCRRVSAYPCPGRRKSMGAPKAPMPGFIESCDPTLQERAPTGDGWVYEIKTEVTAPRSTCATGGRRYSSSGYDWTEKYAAIAKAALKLKVREAIIDGEATVLGNTGPPDFQACAANWEIIIRKDLFIMLSICFTSMAVIFDVLALAAEGGPEINSARCATRVGVVDFLEADGNRVFEHACRMGLEGIVAKRVEAPYRSGRQDISDQAQMRQERHVPDRRLCGEARGTSPQDRLTLRRTLGGRSAHLRRARRAAVTPRRCP